MRPSSLVGSSGLEPPTSRLSGARSSLLSYEPVSVLLLARWFLAYLGGDEEIRTLDPLLAGQVLSQLSYTPRFILKSGSVPFRALKIEQQLCFDPSQKDSCFILLQFSLERR